LRIKWQSLIDNYGTHRVLFIVAALVLLLVIVLVIVLLVILFKRPKAGQPNSNAKAVPKFEEVFEIENEIFEESPYPADSDALLDSATLRTITATLLIGLTEFLAKSAENPSDQHKSMRAIGTHLASQGITPIAFTQWSQSPVQGIAAKIIVAGKARNVILGPSIAMARATASFLEPIATAVAAAQAKGNSVYVLGVDGLAYGTFEVSHRLQEVTK
jgi:Cu+-exporting ATPase